MSLKYENLTTNPFCSNNHKPNHSAAAGASVLVTKPPVRSPVSRVISCIMYRYHGSPAHHSPRVCAHGVHWPLPGSLPHPHPRLPLPRVSGEAGVGVTSIRVVTPGAQMEAGTLTRAPPTGKNSEIKLQNEETASTPDSEYRRLLTVGTGAVAVTHATGPVIQQPEVILTSIANPDMTRSHM